MCSDRGTLIRSGCSLDTISTYRIGCIRPTVNEEKVDSRNVTSKGINETLETHTDPKDGHFASEELYGLARYTGICGRMAGAGGYNEKVNFEGGEGGGVNGIVTDDGDICAEEGEGLVKVPGEGVKVVDEKDVDGAGELDGKRKGHDECS